MVTLQRAATLPIFLTPPDFAHPSGDLVAWLTEPPGIVVQFAQPARGTQQLVAWLLEVVEPLFSQHFSGRSDLVFLLDLRNMTARDGAARSLLLQRAPSFRGRFSRTFILPPAGGGTLATLSIQAAAALLRTFGIPVEVERSLARVQTLCELRPASAS
jgi:hypothetical protein